MKTHPTLLILLLCLFPPVLVGQDSVSVEVTGELQIPADRIHLQINLTTTETTPEKAFEEHKRQENLLARLIREQDLEDALHSFGPVSISSRSMREERRFVTSQNAELILENFSLYEELQLHLVKNGFENISGRFSSSELETAVREALHLALETARREADQIADALDRTIERVHSVSHSTYRTLGRQGMRLAESAGDYSSMMDFEGTITVSRHVSVIYHLAEPQGTEIER